MCPVTIKTKRQISHNTTQQQRYDNTRAATSNGRGRIRNSRGKQNASQQEGGPVTHWPRNLDTSTSTQSRNKQTYLSLSHIHILRLTWVRNRKVITFACIFYYLAVMTRFKTLILRTAEGLKILCDLDWTFQIKLTTILESIK